MKTEKPSPLKRIFKYALRYKWRLFAGIIAGILVGGSLFGALSQMNNVVEPSTSEATTTGLIETAKADILNFFNIQETDENGVITLGFAFISMVGFIILFAFKGLFTYLNRYFMRWVGGKVVQDLRNDLFKSLSSQSLKFYGKSDVGGMISRILSDTGSVERVVSASIADLTRSPMEIAGLLLFIGFMAYDKNMLSVLVLILLFIPLVILPIVFIGKKIKKYARKSLARIAELTAHMMETFTGIKVVKAYGMEEKENEQFVKINQGYFRQMMRALRAELLLSPIMETAGVCGACIFLAYSYSNGIPFSEILPIGAAAMMLYSPLKKVEKVYANIQRSMAGADRVFEYIDLVPELVERDNPVALKEFNSKFEFKNVNFTYEQNGPKIIDSLNLEIKSGDIVAFVGETGSGKTTISNLLARFYDVTSGEILIDGVNIQDVKVQDLRDLIGVVNQDTILFNNSIRYNIAYGSEGATQEEIEAAAKKANAHEFIMEEEEGYDRNVGEKGFRLSGGQKQRISIARAILKNPPILILDEATSALDTVTEKLVQDALNNLMESRTVFAIAHRLSTIRHANKICVLEKGEIIEMGTHDELYAAGGTYHRLCKMQFD